MLFDLLYSLRRLQKGKGVTFAIVLTLGLCVGANTLVFSILYALVLKPLPFPEPARLIEITNAYPKSGQNSARGNVVQYLDYEKHPELFAGVCLYHLNSGSVGGRGPIQVGNAWVTPSFFATMGVQPVLGHFFPESASTAADFRYMVLTESYWKGNFNADPAIVGRKILYGEDYFTVVGVAPKSIESLTPNLGFLTPIYWDTRWFNDMSRHSRDFLTAGRLFARIQPGIGLSQAAAGIGAIDRAYYDHGSVAYKRFCDRSGYHTSVNPLQDAQADAQRNTLMLLQGASLLVLMIGCANVTNLILARAVARQPEWAVRQALGANQWALIRQPLVEAFLLTASGGTVAIGIASGGIALANQYARTLLPYGYRLQLETEMLAFAVGTILAVGLFIGLVPIVLSMGKSLFGNVRQISGQLSSSRRQRWIGGVLVSGQVAISLLLLIGTGLLVRSLFRAAAVDPGFDADRVSVARVGVPGRLMSNSRFLASEQDRILNTLRAIPGVDAVGLSTDTPMAVLNRTAPLFIEGLADSPSSIQPVVAYSGISSDYFKALGIPILRGRAFDGRDNNDKSQSVIVDLDIARKYFAGQDPVGRKIALTTMPTRSEDWGTIVGVAGNAKTKALDSAERVPYAYIPIQTFIWAGNSYFIRSHRSPDELAPLIRQIVGTNPMLSLGGIESMRDIVAGTLDSRRAILLLLTSFAGLALILATIGIYGVLAYDVSLRTREIGIRGALGASRQRILALILRQGFRQIGVGLLIGIAGALFLGRVIQNLLFGVDASDPVTLVLMTLVLLTVGMAASFLPAWRAARMNPIIALRYE